MLNNSRQLRGNHRTAPAHRIAPYRHKAHHIPGAFADAGGKCLAGWNGRLAIWRRWWSFALIGVWCVAGDGEGRQAGGGPAQLG